MEPFETLSVDSAWEEAISSQATLRVHSAFRHAINLEPLGGLPKRLLWVGSRKVARSPGAWVLDAQELGFGLEVGADLSVRCCDGGLELLIGEGENGSGRATCLARASGELSDASLPPLRARRSLGQVHDLLESLTSRLRLQPADGFEPEGMEALVERMLEERGGAFAEALAAGCCHRADIGARRLIGLGPGLTPSGDDLIVGSLALMDACCSAGLLPEGHRHPPLPALHAKELDGLTTAVSAMYLESANEGRYSDHVAGAVSSLLCADEQGVEAAIDRLLSFGAHSGADALRGMRLCASWLASPRRKAEGR